MQKVGVEKSTVILKSTGVIECGKSRLLGRPGCIRDNASLQKGERRNIFVMSMKTGRKSRSKMTDAGMSPKSQLLPVTSYPTSSNIICFILRLSSSKVRDTPNIHSIERAKDSDDEL